LRQKKKVEALPRNSPCTYRRAINCLVKCPFTVDVAAVGAVAVLSAAAAAAKRITV